MNKIFTAAIAGITVAASLASVSPVEARNGAFVRHSGGGHRFGGGHRMGMGQHGNFGNFGGHRGYYGGGRRYYGGGYGGGYYGGDYGYDDGAVGAGILGLAAGALIGGALSHHNYSSGGSCAARFQSYNRASGTYLGYDGRRHHCP